MIMEVWVGLEMEFNIYIYFEKKKKKKTRVWQLLSHASWYIWRSYGYHQLKPKLGDPEEFSIIDDIFPRNMFYWINFCIFSPRFGSSDCSIALWILNLSLLGENFLCVRKA